MFATRLRLVVAFFAMVSVSNAQEVRASITGTVTDAQGAAVPGVTITAVNIASNVSIAQVTNDSGLYLTPFLAPGVYRLTAEKQGFRRYVHDRITLQTQDRPRLDIVLEVGELAQSVTVTAEVSMPPRPIIDSIRYGPICDGRERAM